MADRTPAGGGIFERQGDEGNNLFGGESRRSPRTRLIGKRRFQESEQESFDPRFTQLFQTQGGFHLVKSARQAGPPLPPETDGLRTDAPSLRNRFIGRTLLRIEHDLEPANQSLGTALTTKEALQQTSLAIGEGDHNSNGAGHDLFPF